MKRIVFNPLTKIVCIILFLLLIFIKTSHITVSNVFFIFEGFSLLHFIKNPIPENLIFYMPFIPLLNYLWYSFPSYFDNILFFFLFFSIIFILLSISNLVDKQFSAKVFNVFIFLFLVIFNISDLEYLDLEQLVFTLTILLSLAFIIIRNDRYEDNNFSEDIITGLMISSSLLIKSVLCLFPFLIVLYDFLCFRNRFSFKKSLIFLIFSYIFLIPWFYLTWYLTGQFIPFEYHRADTNIITGALGMIETIEGNSYSLVNDVKDSNILLWAINYIFQHPLIYFIAFLKRIVFFIKLSPFFVFLSFLSLWLYRKNKHYKLIVITFLYLVIIHCLMPVEKRYFSSAVTLSILMGSLFLLKVICLCGSIVNEVKDYQSNQKIFLFMSIPIFVFSFFCCFFIILYPFMAKTIDEECPQKEKENPIKYLYCFVNEVNNANGRGGILFANKYLKSTKRKDVIYENISLALEIINAKDIHSFDKERIKSKDFSYPLNLKKILLLKYIENGDIKEAKRYMESNKKSFFAYVREEQSVAPKDIKEKLLNDLIDKDWVGYITLLPSYQENKSKIMKNLILFFNACGKKHYFFQSQVKKCYLSQECQEEKVSNAIFSALSLEQSGKFEEALIQLTKFSNVKCYKIYTEIGNCNFMLGNYDKAIENFEVALKLCPYAQDSYYGLVCSYVHKNKQNKLKELIENAEIFGVFSKEEIKKILNSCKKVKK